MAASPLCTWLVAACMSVAADNEFAPKPSMVQCSKRLSRWGKRRRVLAQCSDFARGGSISSSIQGLVSSCLAFEPCDQYCSSKGLPYSAFFGDNALSSLFGSKSLPLNRRQRRTNRGSHSGNSFFSCYIRIELVFVFG